MSRGARRNRWWLCLAPCLMCTLDQVLTLYGQPAGYWAGEFAQAHEASPIGNWLLVQHPLLFELHILLFLAAAVITALAWERATEKSADSWA